MLIILEGPDGGGKSTLMEALRFKPGAVHVSMLGGRTMDHEAMRSRTYQAIRRAKEETVVCERFHPISDVVYRSLFGGPRVFSQFEFDQMFVGMRAPTILYCRPPLQAAIDAGIQKAGDDDDEWIMRIGAKLPDLFGSYDTLMLLLQTRGWANVIRYDYTEGSQAKLIEEWFSCAE